MKYSKILAASASTSILAVIENLPVSANGFFLTEEQMNSVEAALCANETVAADLVQAQANLGTANASLATAQSDLATAKTEIETLKASTPPAAVTVKEEDEQPKTDAKRYTTIYDSL